MKKTNTPIDGQVNSKHHDLKASSLKLRARDKYVEEKLRQRTQNGDWNPCEVTRRNTKTYLSCPFRQRSPKVIGFEFGPSTFNVSYRQLQENVKEHFPLPFIQFLEVHSFSPVLPCLLEYRRRKTPNLCLLVTESRYPLRKRSSRSGQFILSTGMLALFDESKPQGLCHNRCFILP